MNQQHNWLKEGIITGIIGATTVAIWFFVVDAVAGHPLYTPQLLGRGLLHVLGKDASQDTLALQVIIYTIFHYVAFGIVGILLTVIVHQAARTPGILAGFLILLVILEAGFYELSALMTASSLGELAWWQVMAANVVSAVLMLVYTWRRHPGLANEFREALEGRDA